MNFTVLSLGGNLGNVVRNFQTAYAALVQAGLQDARMSSIFITPPVDCAAGCPDFFNAAICGLWPDTPEELLDTCQALEIKAGRPLKHGYNAPRPLDIDIIVFGAMQLNTPRLTIPHPEAGKRLFVLIPAAEIAPETVLPGLGKTFSEILRPLIGTDEYLKISEYG